MADFLPPSLWTAGMTQPSVPVNDNALRFLISQSDVDNATTAQPGSPSDGDCFIMQSTHTGTQWATFAEDDLVVYYGGTWYNFTPSEGNRVSVGGDIYMFTSGSWSAVGGGGGSAVKMIPIACSDETTSLSTGTAKVTFRMPFAMTLTDVRASVTTAPTGGTLLTVDINESGSSILSTKLTFDASEKTTTTATTPPVISDASLADDAEITIDIDAVGSSTPGAGLKVYLIGT